jgi:DNA-binding NtrC family response regulator
VVECDSPLSGSTRHCLDDIDEVIIGRGAERTFRRERCLRRLTLTVPDSLVSSTHAALRRTDGKWILQDMGARNGCYVAGRRVDHAELADGAAIELGHTFFLLRSRRLERPVTADLDTAWPADGELLPGTLNHELEAVRARLLTIARSGIPIMLVGETGTGKARFARALHDAAKKGLFVTVNCGLVAASGVGNDASASAPAEHFATELARAARGTLFLRHLAELGASDQLALLRALDRSANPGAPRRADHNQAIVSSIECCSSTLLPDARVRRDLWAHLAGFAVQLPALRERREDLGAIAAEMLREILGASAKRATLHPELVRAWLAHDWPFNLRELENSLRTAVALANGGRIRWAPAGLHPVARDDTPPPLEARAEPIDAAVLPSHSVEPDPDFVQGVRRALRSNLSIACLQKSPLLGAAMVLQATNDASDATESVPALRQIILSAIDSMRATARGERLSQVLHLTFITPAKTQHEAADQMAMAFGTYRRHVTSALSELITILWFRELSARAARERSRTDPPPRPSAHALNSL